MSETLMFDYVIVGAGSAGCVLANRLSARSDVTVALLEAGGEERASGFICLLASLSCSTIRLIIGFITPSLSPSSRVVPMSFHEARPLEDPARLTAWSTSVVNARTTTIGGSWGMSAGTTTRCCLTFAKPKTKSAARMNFTASVVRRLFPILLPARMNSATLLLLPLSRPDCPGMVRRRRRRWSTGA